MDAAFGLLYRGANAAGVDGRVTSDGNTRIVAGDQAGRGAMTINETFEPFSFVGLSAKWSGSWDPATVYVRYAGSWVEPVKAYKKISGVWQRMK